MRYLLLLLLVACSKDYEYCKFNNRVIKYEETFWTSGEMRPFIDSFNLYQPKAHLPKEPSSLR